MFGLICGLLILVIGRVMFILTNIGFIDISKIDFSISSIDW